MNSVLHPHLFFMALATISASAVCARVPLFKKHPAAAGLLMGLASVFCTVYSEQYKQVSFIANIRDVPVLLSMLFFGPLAGGIAATFSIIARVAYGIAFLDTTPGTAFAYGCTTTLSTVLLAYLLSRFIFNIRCCGLFGILTIAVCAHFGRYLALSFVFTTYDLLDELMEVFLPELVFSCLAAAASFAWCIDCCPLPRNSMRINTALLAAYLCIVSIVGFCLPQSTIEKSKLRITSSLDFVQILPGRGMTPWALETLDKLIRNDSPETADSLTLQEIAWENHFDELIVTTLDGKLLCTSSPMLDLQAAFRELWEKRLCHLAKTYPLDATELFFAADGTRDGLPRFYICQRVPDKEKLIFASVTQEDYHARMDELGVPLIYNEEGDENEGFPVITVGDEQTIIALPRTQKVYLGEKLSYEAIRSEASLDTVSLVSVVGIKCLAKAKRLGDYGFFVFLPCRNVFASDCVTLKMVAVFLAFLFVAVGFVLSKYRHIQERIELQRQAEAKRHAEDLATANTIQHSALPNIFPPSAWDFSIDIYASMHPAKEVGGDFYDLYYLSPTRIAILVADVSDKGIPAAMFMMRAKSMLHTSISNNGALGEAITAVNKELSRDNAADMFITSWIGILNTADGVLEYVNAGHNAPYIRHKDGTLTKLDHVSGLFLAGMEETQYVSSSTRLMADDTLFLFTDGITEANNIVSEMYGEKKLEECLKKFSPATTAVEDLGVPRLLCSSIIADVRAFAGKACQFDDMTTLALFFRGKNMQASITINATFQELPRMAEFLEEHLKACNCSRQTRDQLLVVLDEIAANVLNYSGSPDFTMSFQMISSPRTILLTFIDSGKPYNPLDAPAPDLEMPDDERPIGGLGLFIVKKTMDDLYYKHTDGQNKLSMLKRLRHIEASNSSIITNQHAGNK